MSHALYRKYRSKKLSEIVGQSHVTDLLSRALQQDRISHAYLLTGPRGVGKTSIARILAHEINNLEYTDESQHLDIIEIDAASNNGVEDVRSLREKVNIAPVSAPKKVYIIDEVHMLSKPAFNALLKTLEEPPLHAVFILATTNAEKLPATIISRVQKFTFRPITISDATSHLTYIAKQEKISIDKQAIETIAKRGEGSFRDSISLLDQMQSLTKNNESITKEHVEQALGLSPQDLIEQLIDSYLHMDNDKISELLKESENTGISAATTASQLIDEVRDRVSTHPQLLPLLIHLIDVQKSSRPDISLLVALMSNDIRPKKTVALVSSRTRNSPQIITLETSNQNNKKKSSNIKSHSTFEWEKLIEYTKKNYVAIFSVLSKCHYEIQDENLMIYAGNSFYKKKLDDSKHRINLVKALEETNGSGFLVEIIGTTPPPKDSVAASVAAIMGGGEEVEVEE